MRRTSKRLTQVWETAPIIPFDSRSRIVIMSDCHRGVGNWGDNFLPNQNLFFAALNYYYKRGFTYIELGDGDELWENRNPSQIIDVHSDAFWLMSRFHREGRFLMVYGNHDRIKEKKKLLRQYYEQFYCAADKKMQDLFPEIEAWEGIRLRNEQTGRELFLTHGHQGDLMNDTLWKLGRFLVRYVWRPLELFGVNDRTSTAKNYQKANRVEKKLKSWAWENERTLVAGHTHRPSLARNPTQKEGAYYNTGSCIHPRCITALEIQNGQIRLVKWATFIRENNNLFVDREILEGPQKL